MAADAAHAEAAQRAWGGRTMRLDAWWVQPAITAVVLLGFVAYATFRVFENAHYSVGIYHSPFGSPDLRPFVPFLALAPITVSPAMVLLPFPAGFRLTCYYYRKAYYRSFGQRPTGCSVKGWTPRDYDGERHPILRLQNLHRYFLYLALVVLAFNVYDAIGAFGIWERTPQVRAGSLLFLANAVLLSGYTFGCHSLRHLVGGKLDCYSCDPGTRARHRLWKGVSRLNAEHMAWAWASLIVVALLDFYVRGVSLGWWGDVRLV